MKKTLEKKTAAAANGELDPLFVPLARAFEKDREVTVGKMFGSVGLKVNGKVFAMVVKGRFVAKLPKHRVDELVASKHGAHFDPGRA